MDAVEASNHRCDGPHLQFMTHLQHVLIEPEATPMRLMPCVPPTQTGLPLPSTRLQVFTAHGNAVAAAAAATEANLCARHRRNATVLSASLRSPRGARHRARRCTGSMPPSSPPSPHHLQQHSQRRRRRRRRGGGGDQGGRGDEGSGLGDRNDDPILEKGNRRTATARSGSAAYAFGIDVSSRVA